MKQPAPEFKVFTDLDEVLALRPKRTALTLGVFDGVHLGHRCIIESLIRCRTSGQVKSCFLITFDPHPVVVTHSRITPPILTTIDERIDLLRCYFLDGIFIIRFDAAIADMDYRLFIDKYLLSAFDMEQLILGYDCHFGRNREGSPEQVRQYGGKNGFQTKIIPPVKKGGEVISSSHIRNKLLEGNLDKANQLLGHPYTFAGSVVRGHGMGRSVGFATANLAIENPHKLRPPGGVYAVIAHMRGRAYPGMMNIGKAPTLKKLREGAQEIEVHLFDWEDDLYSEKIIVHCHALLREERSFPSVEALREQLARDKEKAIQVLEGGGKQAGMGYHCA
jgi:riboflavin kinase/FMN adenylyltransferase